MKPKKEKEKLTASELKQGLVMRSTGSHYRVKDEAGNLVECVIRGKFRLQGLKTTNPIAVGDCVQFMLESSADDGTVSGVITALETRENYILRKATNLSAQQQILCANVDQAIIVLTIKQPDMSLGFTDRFLVMTGAFHIPAVLIFNKIDLLDNEDDFYYLEAYTEMYRAIGYPVHHISARDEKYLPELVDIFKDKTSFLYGRSGAGKTSMINLIAPELSLRTGVLSDWSGRGKHTTTFAEMFELNFGGYIIDAPGLREFEPTDIEKTEIAHYMPEFLKHIHNCKYNDCTHYNEPGCAVKEALENEEISPTRYESYMNMLLHIKPEEWRN